MQALSRREETAVVELVKKQARQACDEWVRDFANCARGRSFSISWACKPQLALMNDCMRANVTTEKLDASKLDYIANRSERGRQAVEDLRTARIESYKRQAGIKAEPKERV